MAKVRLAPGQVAYYDPITHIHLTLARPESSVPESYDRTGLLRAHRSGVIIFTDTSKKANKLASEKKQDISKEAAATSTEDASKVGKSASQKEKDTAQKIAATVEDADRVETPVAEASPESRSPVIDDKKVDDTGTKDVKDNTDSKEKNAKSSATKSRKKTAKSGTKKDE